MFIDFVIAAESFVVCVCVFVSFFAVCYALRVCNTKGSMTMHIYDVVICGGWVKCVCNIYKIDIGMAQLGSWVGVESTLFLVE